MIKYISIDIIIFFLIFLLTPLSHASTNDKKVNILTWWDYLNYPGLIEDAEKKCRVKISFDEYFSNDEFLRRWEGQKDNYDIIIFSDTIYGIIKNRVPNIKQSTLWRQSKLYNPVVKLHYRNNKYPHNIVYYIHSMTGFLWNPENIKLSGNDSLSAIFNKASNNFVVIIDDPIEAKKLLESSLAKKSNGEALTLQNFKELIQNSEVYITNNYSQIYKKSKFAFSFTWSGEAIVDIMESHKKYEFLIHPKLSYISSDLLAQISNKNNALCVAKFLTTKNSMSVIQRNDFYFSPYTDYSNVNNPIFKDIYKKFIATLPTLPWLDSIDNNTFQKTNMAWQLIKLEVNKKIRRKEWE
jgi:ABC-type thiamine transport system substrate-binding protein